MNKALTGRQKMPSGPAAVQAHEVIIAFRDDLTRTKADKKRAPKGPQHAFLESVRFPFELVIVASPVPVFLNAGCAKSAHAVIVDELLPRVKFLFGQRISVTRILE